MKGLLHYGAFCFLCGYWHAMASDLAAVEWFPEPSGLRVVNQSELVGVIGDGFNISVTQTFTVDSPGSVSAIGLALGASLATPSLTASLHRVADGVIEPSALAISTLPGEYFAHIGPQTVPVWVYAEFSVCAPIPAGEQLAIRVESPFAQLWGARRDVLPGGELVEMAGTDLAFRVYTVPEPSTGVLLVSGFCLWLVASTHRRTRRSTE